MTIIVRSVAEQAYDLMRERILAGNFEAGAPVRQDTVALELGISKIPLREALTRLIEDGLVLSHPNRGFIVCPLSVNEAQEVFLLRLKLEPDATVQGSLGATEADREMAQHALSSLETAMNSPRTKNGPARHVSLNRIFHLALVRPGVGKITYQLLERLNMLVERYVRVHLQPAGRDQRAASEHRNLLAAWLKQDPQAVKKLAQQHIKTTLRDLELQFASDAQLLPDSTEDACILSKRRRTAIAAPGRPARQHVRCGS